MANEEETEAGLVVLGIPDEASTVVTGALRSPPVALQMERAQRHLAAAVDALRRAAAYADKAGDPVLGDVLRSGGDEVDGALRALESLEPTRTGEGARRG